MYYVYIIQSINFPEKFYVGYTLNIGTRILKHNEGRSVHTNKYKPWKLIFHCVFIDKLKAQEFENYLKSHSGRAFMSKRLI